MIGELFGTFPFILGLRCFFDYGLRFDYRLWGWFFEMLTSLEMRLRRLRVDGVSNWSFNIDRFINRRGGSGIPINGH